MWNPQTKWLTNDEKLWSIHLSGSVKHWNLLSHCWFDQKTLKLTTQISWIIDYIDISPKNPIEPPLLLKNFWQPTQPGQKMTCRLRREFRRYAGTLPLTRSSSHLGSQNAKSCRWTDGPNDNGASTDSLTAKKMGRFLWSTKWGQWKWGFGCLWTKPLLNRTNSHDLIR